MRINPLIGLSLSCLFVFYVISCKDNGNKIESDANDLVKGEELLLEDTILSKAKDYGELTESITGYFQLSGEVAIFKYCGSGKTLPISKESCYLKIEQAFTAAIKDVNEPMFIEILGKIEGRENVDGKMTPHIIIDSLISYDPKKTCE